MPVGKCRSQRGKTQTRAAGARHSESLKTRVGARDMVHSVKGLPFTNEEWILVPRRHTKRERIGKGGKGERGVAKDISTLEAHWPISLVDLTSLRSQ